MSERSAVIYCRVSSGRQVKEGNGLASQETRCREYARHKGYEIAAVFRDEGLSGKLMDRPEMKALLKFLRQHRGDRLVVIIDDISRLARDIGTHIHLRSAISEAGGQLESPSLEFGEDSDSRLVEHMLASVAAHHREKNTEQVQHRMRARLQNGYWCFQNPPGYVYKRVSGHGKLLVRDEPVASVIAEALEGFASGFLSTQTEFQRYLEASPHFPKDSAGRVHYSRVKHTLTKPLYAGFIDYPDWGIHMVPGKHEPIISAAVFRKVHERLNAKAIAPARKDISGDFPLRGFVTCGACGSVMTSCWSQGRAAKYPYYLCANKACSERRKSIRREKLEGEFETLLGHMQPPEEVLATATDIFADAWDTRYSRLKSDVDALRMQLARTERKSEQLLDRIVDADDPGLIKAYEKKIGKLSQERAELNERIANCGRPLRSFDESFRTALGFLANPQKLWHSGHLEYQRTVLRLTFTENLPYHRNEGFRTAAIAQPLSFLSELSRGNYKMVDLDVERLNHLLAILEDWERILKALKADAILSNPVKSAA